MYSTLQEHSSFSNPLKFHIFFEKIKFVTFGRSELTVPYQRIIEIKDTIDYFSLLYILLTITDVFEIQDSSSR